jgi:PAS domain S-box-containing protein
MTWLRSRPRSSLALACAGLAVVLLADLAAPGYVPAAGYLVLLTFAAVALRPRPALLVAGAALALTLAVMILQERTGGENLLLVWLGVLAGAGVLALALLFSTIETLYEAESENARHIAFQADLLANVHDAVVALDPDYHVTYWNVAAADLFGLPAEAALGSPLPDVLHGTFREEDGAAAVSALQRDGWYRSELPFRLGETGERWLDAHAQVIRSESGELEGYVVSLRDVDERRKAERALALEAARLRAILDAAPVGFGIVGRSGEVLLRNDVLRQIWLGEAAVGSVEDFSAYKAFWPETGARLEPQDWPAAKALSDGSSFADVIVDIERFDGTRGTIVLSTAPILDGDEIAGAVTIVQDITSLRETEQALRFLTDEVRALHEALVTGESLSSIELAAGVVVQAGQLLGSDGGSIFLLEEDGSLRRTAGVGVPDPDGADDLAAQVIGDRRPATLPGPRASPAREGEDTRRAFAVPVMIRDQVFGAMTFTYEDGRRLDEAKIRIAQAFADQAALALENARLTSRIEASAIEAERTRLARDLHDSVTQSLFAASLKAEALAELLGPDGGWTSRTAEDLRRLTLGALAGMRTMLLEMRPDGLSQTPLPELLRHLVEASGGRIGADARLVLHGERSLPAEVRSVFYRIAQEALNNVARHARAEDVVVELALGERAATLSVKDDGCGFDPGGVPRGHLGLTIMHERAESIGASLDVATGVGRGTVVTVEWPWGEREGHDE